MSHCGSSEDPGCIMQLLVKTLKLTPCFPSNPRPAYFSLQLALRRMDGVQAQNRMLVSALQRAAFSASPSGRHRELPVCFLRSIDSNSIPTLGTSEMEGLATVNRFFFVFSSDLMFLFHFFALMCDSFGQTFDKM